jgi:hypothetical protein
MLPLAAALALTAATTPPTPPPAPPASAERIIQLRVPGPCPDMDPHFVIYVPPPARHPGANPLAWLLAGPAPAADQQVLTLNPRLSPACPGLRMATHFGAAVAGGNR